MAVGYWTKGFHLETTLAGENAVLDVLKTLEDCPYAIVNASGATVVKAGSGTYFGYRILGAAGAFVMNIYDNIAASGQKLDLTDISVAAAADGRSKIGTRFTTGLTVNTSGDVTDGMIQILYI